MDDNLISMRKHGNQIFFHTVHIFREFPEIKLKWQKRLEYIMIDEFQDINYRQYCIVRLLAERHKNVQQEG